MAKKGTIFGMTGGAFLVLVVFGGFLFFYGIPELVDRGYFRFSEAPPLCNDAPKAADCVCEESMVKVDAVGTGRLYVCEPYETFMDPLADDFEEKALEYYKSVLVGECETCNVYDCPYPGEIDAVFGVYMNEGRRVANVECWFPPSGVDCTPKNQRDDVDICMTAYQVSRLQFYTDTGEIVRDDNGIPYWAVCSHIQIDGLEWESIDELACFGADYN